MELRKSKMKKREERKREEKNKNKSTTNSQLTILRMATKPALSSEMISQTTEERTKSQVQSESKIHQEEDQTFNSVEDNH
jgi:hypothetical protein